MFVGGQLVVPDLLGSARISVAGTDVETLISSLPAAGTVLSIALRAIGGDLRFTLVSGDTPTASAGFVLAESDKWVQLSYSEFGKGQLSNALRFANFKVTRATGAADPSELHVLFFGQ